mgnify:CR=1 FL=1
MLSVIVFLPLTAAVALVAAPGLSDAAARRAWLTVTAADLALVVCVWLRYEPPAPGELAFAERLAWIPGVGASYHVGVDGLSLPLVALTAVVFTACAAHALREGDRPRRQAALLLFLETTCLGVFVAADLILFFVFFDLSIVGMYFVIAGWGHGDARRSAVTFFLYTFLGSLALLLGFIGLWVAGEPGTFDMVELTGHPPFPTDSAGATLVLVALLLGFAVKTPIVPVHTWLPPAHTDAPAIGSAVLAAVLLKMGGYGFARIAMPMLPAAWRALAPVILAFGIVSVLYGALVALGQRDLKRMIAYTSVNHMGYLVVGLAAAGLVTSADASVRAVAVTGAVTQMVGHGLVTGALFLLVGAFWDRARSYDVTRFGGLAGPAPRLATLFTVAAFASLGLPGFIGFVAEFQVFVASIAAAPVAALALPGILVTAALFLRALRAVFAGPPGPGTTGFADLRSCETAAVAPLLLAALLLGVVPRPLLDVIEPAAAAAAELVGR